MAIETRERHIDGLRYTVTHMPTRKGLALLVRLTKILGPGLGAFLGGAGRAARLPGESGTEVALALGTSDAVHDLCERLDAGELQFAIDELARCTTVQVERDEPVLADIFDDHFAGRYDVLLRWLRFALEVNYARTFTDGTGSGVWSRLMTVLSALQSQPASTGPSTGSPPAGATPPH